MLGLVHVFLMKIFFCHVSNDGFLMTGCLLRFSIWCPHCVRCDKTSWRFFLHACDYNSWWKYQKVPRFRCCNYQQRCICQNSLLKTIWQVSVCLISRFSWYFIHTSAIFLWKSQFHDLTQGLYTNETRYLILVPTDDWFYFSIYLWGILCTIKVWTTYMKTASILFSYAFHLICIGIIWLKVSEYNYIRKAKRKQHVQCYQFVHQCRHYWD